MADMEVISEQIFGQTSLENAEITTMQGNNDIFNDSRSLT
nr:hypothetical protein Iba_chr01aCG8170 [Ipomoea batatas]